MLNFEGANAALARRSVWRRANSIHTGYAACSVAEWRPNRTSYPQPAARLERWSAIDL